MQEYLKDIGIRLEILEYYPTEWIVDYWENPEGHKRLAYSFGGWVPDYNDPINMIQPLYGTNASSNSFLLNNATWNQKLIDSYSKTELTTPTRRDLFYNIQEDFCTTQAPSFYILQLGATIGFNRDFVDEDSVGGMMNLLGDYWWFDIRFTPPVTSMSTWEYILYTIAAIGVGTLVIVISVTIIRRKRKNVGKPESVRISTVDGVLFCPECGAKHRENIRICIDCGYEFDEERFKT